LHWGEYKLDLTCDKVLALPAMTNLNEYVAKTTISRWGGKLVDSPVRDTRARTTVISCFRRQRAMALYFTMSAGRSLRFSALLRVLKKFFSIYPFGRGRAALPASSCRGARFMREIELELINTQMAQTPMLHEDVYERVLRASQNVKRALV
jgi:hypothetical protein